MHRQAEREGRTYLLGQLVRDLRGLNLAAEAFHEPTYLKETRRWPSSFLISACLGVRILNLEEKVRPLFTHFDTSECWCIEADIGSPGGPISLARHL